MAFVGFTTLEGPALQQLLQNHPTSGPSYYFLRWFHQVSGFIQDLPENFPSPEGQMFNHQWEIRWQHQGDSYEVLILSLRDEEAGFTPIPSITTWGSQDFNALVYSESETRFPHSIQSNGVNLRQRQFFDTETNTIHFIALTL